jgi:hypothetical protein
MRRALIAVGIWLLATGHALGPTQAALAAVASTDIPAATITGTIQVFANGCVLLITPHGQRYEVRGMTAASDGAQASLTGVIAPVRNAVCRAPLAIAVAPGSEPTMSTPAVASPASGPTAPGLRSPLLSPVIRQGGN